MAVRSLQIRAKFITFIEIEAPKVQRCVKIIITRYVSREDIDCMIGDQGESGPASGTGWHT